MKKFFKENGLSIAVFGLFAVFLMGQALAGFQNTNGELKDHHQPLLAFSQYLATGEFWSAVFENWESEFLQIGMYVVLTVFLFQKGSAESKSLEGENEVDKIRVQPHSPWPARKGGWVLKLYSHSLSLALLALFLASFLLHAATGAKAFNEDQAAHGLGEFVTMGQYMLTSRFWFESFQNWQSEFLSVGVLVVLSIFLREKGSPESKPVATPHSEEEAA